MSVGRDSSCLEDLVGRLPRFGLAGSKMAVVMGGRLKATVQVGEPLATVGKAEGFGAGWHLGDGPDGENEDEKGEKEGRPVDAGSHLLAP